MSCGATINHVPDAGAQAIEALAKINPEAILFEPRSLWDHALVGITCKPSDRWERPTLSPWVAVYDFETAVSLHANQADDDVIGDEFVTEIERATEWVMYNSVGSWLGPNTADMGQESQRHDDGGRSCNRREERPKVCGGASRRRVLTFFVNSLLESTNRIAPMRPRGLPNGAKNERNDHVAVASSRRQRRDLADTAG